MSAKKGPSSCDGRALKAEIKKQHRPYSRTADQPQIPVDQTARLASERRLSPAHRHVLAMGRR